MPSKHAEHHGLRARVFYSYSHKDTQHRAAMERTLASLKRLGLIDDWSDARIVPGASISGALEARLPESDIIAFLLSPDFLASDECLKEWERAAQLASKGRLVFRVPIIVRDCAWQDLLQDDDLKALPTDGKPITTYADSDTAWQEVYDGIKSVVHSLRTTYTPKPAFLEDLSSSELPSSKPLSIDDIFVFPRLVKADYSNGPEVLLESSIASTKELLEEEHAIIHGQDKSGKTALAKHIFLSLVRQERPVLFADLGTATGRLDDTFLRGLYEDQFHGDYYLWSQQGDKTLVIDNMTEAPRLLDFVAQYSETFSRVYLLVSSDVFHSFLTDEIRLAEFQEIRLVPLTLTQQEQLIRKRLTKLDNSTDITDGFVDQVEDRVNSIIISDRIVPRYPFFVLSILQTYDAYTPAPLTITSYGHCYYVFIIASLRRAGISEADDAVNSCFNFAEQLALATFHKERDPDEAPLDFGRFQREYRDLYFMKNSLLNRLTHKDYGILTESGEFKTAYMYYFFLGKILATDPDFAEEYLSELCEDSHHERNYLTLLFAIHHATDDKIIEDILLRTMIELEDVPVATLSENETARFSSIVAELPESVLSDESVEEERAKQRSERDGHGNGRNRGGEVRDRDAGAVRASMFRVLKNNKILGQVLRNQYGKLEKGRIQEIVEAIADSSFRLINLVLEDETEIRKLALHIKAGHPEADLTEVQQILRYLSFMWTMMNVEQAVQAVNVPSIREAVEGVVEGNASPAYDLLGYFSQLDGAEELTDTERDRLDALLRRHDDEFIRRVLSIRTQMYMNTHRSKTRVEQSVCSVLGIKYFHRPIAPA